MDILRTRMLVIDDSGPIGAHTADEPLKKDVARIRIP